MMARMAASAASCASAAEGGSVIASSAMATHRLTANACRRHSAITPSISMVHDSLNRPGPGGQPDPPACRRRRTRPGAPPDSFPDLVADRGQIGRGRAGPAEERLPVVVEVLKDGGNVDGAHRDRLQSRSLEERPERPRLAEREPLGLLPPATVRAHR